MIRSTSGRTRRWPRSMWPRRRAWWAPAPRPRPVPGAARCGRCGPRCARARTWPLTTRPGRDVIGALIAGQRDPQALAGPARTRMQAKHAALAGALDGMFADHHAELARLLLDQIAFPDTRITRLTRLIDEQIDAIPA